LTHKFVCSQAKKREIVEFASGKGKNKLGSREKEETDSMVSLVRSIIQQSILMK
jgi:hypothetical protein